MGLSLLPILVHIQTHLDGDLSLARLASRAGLSSSHFHRTFRAQTGETPKQYTQRLRLERAALRLCLHRTTVLQTALDVGFQSHETFTRAFQKRFQVPPKEVLRRGVTALRASPTGESHAIPVEPPLDYELSATKLVDLKPMRLAFIRHVGPYENVDDSIWAELESWADRVRLLAPRVHVGIGHDSPGITAPEKLRFDAALPIDRSVREMGSIGQQELPGGRYALATHIGHYSTLAETYGRLVRRIAGMKGVRFAGLPAIEIYHETTINVESSLNHTDIYLPVRPT